ncbi:MAG TPA: dihydrofolate reductase [Ignavibacteriales bacterium]|nr:dihydrofolate reductase [Ignavibacteriales bacterium]HOL81545.1 dihydrofolate reductase [Ignavibacteriales bacterium]HPP33659.1 dihydrofolate reductase [Ignavibacteriales bacterium]HRR18894.1 dihydrofolate reductase [Ignavibacteriales bacterium]
MKFIIIVAVSENNAIGLNGKMPWYNSDDLKFFKKTTMNYPVVMGRKTFESLGKTLPGRLNIIVSKQLSKIENSDAIVIDNLDKLSEKLDELKNNQNYKQISFDKCFIIGGGSIYQQSLSFVDEIIISRIPGIYQADTFFPVLSDDWKLFNQEDFTTFKVEYYKRK